MDTREVNGLVVAGGVLAGLVAFGVWTLVTVAVVYGASSALGDTGGTAVGIALVVLPVAAAVLLLSVPATRTAAAGFVAGSAGGFLLGVIGALVLFVAAGFSL